MCGFNVILYFCTPELNPLKITGIVAGATAAVYVMGKLVNGYESGEDYELGGLGFDDTDIDPYGVKFVSPFYESGLINDPTGEISRSEFESIVNDVKDYGVDALILDVKARGWLSTQQLNLEEVVGRCL